MRRADLREGLCLRAGLSTRVTLMFAFSILPFSPWKNGKIFRAYAFYFEMFSLFFHFKIKNMDDYNTCSVCGKTNDYDKWYKEGLSSCRVCFVTMCEECMNNEFVTYCSIPYGTHISDLKSVCNSCKGKEQDPQEAKDLQTTLRKNLYERVSAVVREAYDKN